MPTIQQTNRFSYSKDKMKCFQVPIQCSFTAPKNFKIPKKSISPSPIPSTISLLPINITPTKVPGTVLERCSKFDDNIALVISSDEGNGFYTCPTSVHAQWSDMSSSSSPSGSSSCGPERRLKFRKKRRHTLCSSNDVKPSPKPYFNALLADSVHVHDSKISPLQSHVFEAIFQERQTISQEYSEKLAHWFYLKQSDVIGWFKERRVRRQRRVRRYNSTQ